jgi:DNA invertase Pin-like site-specific DNA recombinase
MGLGLRTQQRPGLVQLRDLMHGHEIDIVVVARFDRIAREMTELTAFAREAEECGVRIESISEPGVLSSDVSAHIRQFAEHIERSEIRRRRMVRH